MTPLAVLRFASGIGQIYVIAPWQFCAAAFLKVRRRRDAGASLRRPRGLASHVAKAPCGAVKGLRRGDSQRNACGEGEAPELSEMILHEV